jgi:hypothetical protein
MNKKMNKNKNTNKNKPKQITPRMFRSKLLAAKLTLRQALTQLVELSSQPKLSLAGGFSCSISTRRGSDAKPGRGQSDCSKMAQKSLRRRRLLPTLRVAMRRSLRRLQKTGREKLLHWL